MGTSSIKAVKNLTELDGLYMVRDVCDFTDLGIQDCLYHSHKGTEHAKTYCMVDAEC